MQATRKSVSPSTTTKSVGGEMQQVRIDAQLLPKVDFNSFIEVCEPPVANFTIKSTTQLEPKARIGIIFCCAPSPHQVVASLPTPQPAGVAKKAAERSGHRGKDREAWGKLFFVLLLQPSKDTEPKMARLTFGVWQIFEDGRPVDSRATADKGAGVGGLPGS